MIITVASAADRIRLIAIDMKGAFGNEGALPLFWERWLSWPRAAFIIGTVKVSQISIAVLVLACMTPVHAQDAETPERLTFTEDDLPKDERDPAGLSEIDEVAQRRGLNYARTTRRAARGDAKALRQFFALADDVDGA